jgi:predicted naringenin-chalcone synthase
MSLAILGLGTALPPHTVSQAQCEELAVRIASRAGGSLPALGMYRRSGISSRRSLLDPLRVYGWVETSVGPDPLDGGAGLGPSTAARMEIYRQEALPLALRAAAAALDAARLEARAITHLVTVSCTGFAAPGVDIGLFDGLGLDPGVERTHLGFMGCHGALNGLRVARAFSEADPRVRLLLCAVEFCSLHYHFGAEPGKLVGNALFADGAAALVGGPPEAGRERSLRVAANGSSLFPGCREAMTWVIGDHGFEMALSRRVPELIRGRLRSWLEGWLRKEGLELAGVRSWAVHPGGPRILTAVEESLGLGEEATAVSREVLSECGNMSSPTVLFILERLRERGAPCPCVMLGFGPGLVAEAALLLE